MPEYRLTPAAEGDLEGIWLYTAEQWGVKQANHYIDILSATFSDLAQHPKPLLPVTTYALVTEDAVLNSI